MAIPHNAFECPNIHRGDINSIRNSFFEQSFNINRNHKSYINNMTSFMYKCGWKIYTSQNARLKALYTVALDLLDLKENLDTGATLPYKIKWVLIDAKLSPFREWDDKERYKRAYSIVKYDSDEFVGNYYTNNPDSTLKDAKIYSGIVFHLYPSEDLEKMFEPAEELPRWFDF